MRWFIGFCLLLVMGTFAAAQHSSVSYYDGYRQGGFTYHVNFRGVNGAYWYDSYGNPHTLSYTTTPGYYQNGCWTASTTYPVYTRYYAPAPEYVAPAPAVPSYNDPGWRGKLLDIAAQKDKLEAKIRADALEHQYYMQAVDFLGLRGSLQSVPAIMGPSFAPYSAPMPGAPGYSLSGHYYSYPLVANANTQTGYSYNSLTQMYGDTNMTQLYLMANQLALGSQKLSGDASQQFSALVSQAGNNQAKVAEFLAKAEVVKQVLLALQSPPEAKGFKFNITRDGVIERDFSKMDQKDLAAIRQAWGDHAATKCGDCHAPPNKKGGFDLNSYLTMADAEKEARVLSRLVKTCDPKTRMPRNSDGTAAPPITDAEFKLWVMVR